MTGAPGVAAGGADGDGVSSAKTRWIPGGGMTGVAETSSGVSATERAERRSNKGLGASEAVSRNKDGDRRRPAVTVGAHEAEAGEAKKAEFSGAKTRAAES